MRYRLTKIFICLLGSACAAATAGSPFEFQPSRAPHRYDVTVSGDVIADTPMGRMTSETESEATVRLDIGEKQEAGWAVSAVFEALEVRAEGSMGGGSVNAEGVIGRTFTGTLSEAGLISIGESPDVSSRLSDNLDPGAMLTELMAPLPPEGADPSTSWPVSSTVISDAAVKLTSSFTGTARIAGDTIWHGTPATLILAEGTLEIEGTGAPAGGPAEMDLLLEGGSTRLYVWDTARRVMLASLTTGEARGSLSISGMDLQIPASFVQRQEVALRR